MNTLVFTVTFLILQEENFYENDFFPPQYVTQRSAQSIVLAELWNPPLCVVGAAVTF